MTHLAAVIVLLALNGFFVAAEFALVKARGLRFDHLADTGSAAARLTVRIQANLEGYLAACQLGITMASLGLGWLGEPAVTALLKPLFAAIGLADAVLHTVAFLLGFLLIAALHVIVGAQLPRILALRRAEQVSLWVAYPLHCIYVLVTPFNYLIKNTSQAILSLFNVEQSSLALARNDSASNTLVSLPDDFASDEPGKADMLDNIIEFDRRCVKDIMIPRHMLNVLDLTASPEANNRAIIESGHSCLPLIDRNNNDELLGIVQTNIIYRALLEQQRDPWQRLGDFCQAPMIVMENQKIAQLFDLLRVRRKHIAFVVNEYGSLCGLVTLEDLLDEIVGDIEV